MKQRFRKLYEKFLDIKWSIILFFRWIKKSIQYSLFLKKDFDFDHAYLLYLIQFKIQKMIYYMENHGRCEDVPQRLTKMREVDALIDKYFNYDFGKELREEHREKWGEPSDAFVPIKGSKYLEWKWTYANAKTAEQLEQAEAEKMANFKVSEQARKDCLNQIFNEMRDNIEYWWD